jgi:DNA-binding NtrC family response regulator/tetratricopeptide (TPR) repeat protein
MHGIDTARNLFQEGRFQDALARLDNSIQSTNGNTAQTLRAELLERVGKHSQSEALLQRLIKTKSLTPQDEGAAEHVLGRIANEHGRKDAAITHFQRAIAIARKADDLARSCWSGLSLMWLVAERLGPEAAATLIAQVRADVVKLGNPAVSAALHLYVGEMEAKRGLLRSAERHVRLGQAILQTSPNVWLESAAENTCLAISVLRSDLDAALSHARRGLELAERSGAASSLRACLGNLGNLFTVRGDFDRAVEYFQRSLAVLPSRSENNNASLDGLARIRLSQGRLADCDALLQEIDGTIRDDADRTLYAHRYAELTRTHLLAQENRTQEAIAQSDFVQMLAQRTHDKLLSRMALLARAELLLRAERREESLAALNEVVVNLESSPPDLSAQSEGIMACGLVATGHHVYAEEHFSRAERIYGGLQSAKGLIELRRSWAFYSSEARFPATYETDQKALGRSVLHSIGTMFLHADRTEIVAAELMEILRSTGCVETGVAISRRPDGSESALASFGNIETSRSNLVERRFSIGGPERPVTEFVLNLKNDFGSLATVGAVECLLTSMHSLNQARIERDERSTLWPAEELPIDGDRAVISGHMRDLMNLARRVATTNVNVLITGESGTGKEILARAVHNFSDRAQRPFVPFNCTAIPRDLLESQLFGHRRGAFTGADRDHPGLIRNAREGTLFLDEIGELGLDLQPKLLRFLESGEISPLGEQRPLTVNVRIIAATNANLEDAVRDGRFREDLFYRLNVVRLSIRPLRERRDEIPGLVNHFVARAAEEFNKGRLSIAEETMERLLLYRWPGNVRQLQNELRRMIALTEPDSTLPPEAISEAILGAMPIFRQAPINGKEIAVPLHDKLLPTLARIECEMIKAAFREHHGKVDAVAKALGISRKGLYLKRQRLGL